MKYILDTKEIKDGFLVYDNYNNKCFSIEKTHLLFSDTIKLKNINGSILFKLKKHKVNHHEIFEVYSENNSIIVESDKFKELSLILILIFIIYIKYRN